MMGLAQRKREIEAAAAAGLAVTERYVLGERLDDGGSNEIYAAACRERPGRVAVKLLRRALDAGREAALACRREALQVARVGHPHVAQVLAFGNTEDGVPFLVREYLEGMTLEAHLARRGPMPVAEVLSIVGKVAAALAASHSAGVVHGELRPRKIFLADAAGYPGGFVKLVDFGLSRIAGDRRGPGAMAHVARYSAPEQLDPGRGPQVDGRADQFALAAIAYRMIAGADAFPGDDVAAVLDKVEYDGPAPMGTAVARDPRVDAVIRRGLSRDPRQRFPNVTEFAAALEADAAPRVAPEDTQTVSASEILAVDPAAPSLEPSRWFEELSAAGQPAAAPLTSLDGRANELLDLERPAAYRRRRKPRRHVRVVLLGALLSSAAAAAWWGGWAPPLETLLDSIARLASR